MKLIKFTLVFFVLLSLNLKVFSQNELNTSDGNTVYDIVSSNPVVIDPNLTVTTTSSINNAIVLISEGYIQSDDILIYPNILHGVSGSYNSSNGILTLSGNATAAQYQEILRTIQFNTTGTPLQTIDRVITFSLGDALPFYPCGQTEPHFYKLINAYANDWIGARNHASSQTYFGFQGYLATITCAEENSFITQKLDASAFIGASDIDAEGVWKWMTGPEAGTIFWNNGTTITYDNWNANGEPNNTAGEEHYACIYGQNHPTWGQTGFWNDIRQFPEALDLIAGYVIEFGGMAGDPPLNIADTKTIVFQNSPQLNLTVTGSTVCEGDNGTVIIQGTELNVEYEAFIGTTSVGTVNGTGGNVQITIPTNNLVIGANIVTFTADNGTFSGNLTNSATINVIQNPNNTNTVLGNTICSGNTAEIIILSSENNILYEAFIGTTSVGNTNGTGNNVSISVAASYLQTGENIIHVIASNGNCEIQLTDTAAINVIPGPANSNIVTGSSICAGDDGIVTIISSETNIEYEAFIGTTSVGNATGNGNNLSINISASYLQEGENIIDVFASNGICNTQLNDTTGLWLYLINMPNILTEGSQINYGENGTITLLESEDNITYNLYHVTNDSSTFVANLIGNGSEIAFDIPANLLFEGENNFNIYAQNGKCSELVGNDVVIVQAEVDIPDGFSPNQNGINDYFVIDGIDAYPLNIVKIFNRWGTLVFEMPNYDNNINVWDGKSNKGIKIGGDYLPEGTYFYVVDLGNNLTPIKGTLYLKR
ncbi:MAG: gliding motility-associated C-terminal domain-containing protein [Bacteroidales bacterium]|nr:gliding motility-associated C-terminal domain-containing protein [Bacteroidales bacterium]